MSELKKIREEQNLTQEELAEKSGISVRTIQRIEAGSKPKGFTLKTLASALNIPEKNLLDEESRTEENITFHENVLMENTEEANFALIKIINISTLPFSWLPIANFLIPVVIMLFTKERSSITRQIVSLQIFLAVICTIIFMIVALLRLGKSSVLITIGALTLVNIFIILKNAYTLDKERNLHYKLNFNLL